MNNFLISVMLITHQFWKTFGMRDGSLNDSLLVHIEFKITNVVYGQVKIQFLLLIKILNDQTIIIYSIKIRYNVIIYPIIIYLL